MLDQTLLACLIRCPCSYRCFGRQKRFQRWKLLKRESLSGISILLPQGYVLIFLSRWMLWAVRDTWLKASFLRLVESLHMWEETVGFQLFVWSLKSHISVSCLPSQSVPKHTLEGVEWLSVPTEWMSGLRKCLSDIEHKLAQIAFRSLVQRWDAKVKFQSGTPEHSACPVFPRISFSGSGSAWKKLSRLGSLRHQAKLWERAFPFLLLVSLQANLLSNFAANHQSLTVCTLLMSLKPLRAWKPVSRGRAWIG